jgi:predicted small metal-binding protein
MPEKANKMPASAGREAADELSNTAQYKHLQPKRRFKLLVWAQNAGARRTNAGVQRRVSSKEVSNREGLHVELSHELEEISSSLNAIALAGVQRQVSSEEVSDRVGLHAELSHELEEISSSINAIALERELLAQQTERAQQTIDKSRASLARHARFFREHSARRARPGRGPGSVFWLRLSLKLCGGDHVAISENYLCVVEAVAAHARLARLFAAFQSVDWDLVSGHLLAAGLLQEEAPKLEALSPRDAFETHHCLGLAYLACGRQHHLAERCSQRDTCFKRSEVHLRDAVAMASNHTCNVSMCTQAETHADLAALYAEMSSDSASSSCLSACELHLSKAADKFAAAGLSARSFHKHICRLFSWCRCPERPESCKRT